MSMKSGATASDRQRFSEFEPRSGTEHAAAVSAAGGRLLHAHGERRGYDRGHQYQRHHQRHRIADLDHRACDADGRTVADADAELDSDAGHVADPHHVTDDISLNR